MDATDSPEGKLCSHANGFRVAGFFQLILFHASLPHAHFHMQSHVLCIKMSLAMHTQVDNVSTAMFPWLNFLRDCYFTQPTRCQSSLRGILAPYFKQYVVISTAIYALVREKKTHRCCFLINS